MPSKKTSILLTLSEPKKEIETCVYCETKYDKKEKHEPAKGHCPTCGGTATEEMGYPKSIIGRVYDEHRNPYFKRKEKQVKTRKKLLTN